MVVAVWTKQKVVRRWSVAFAPGSSFQALLASSQVPFSHSDPFLGIAALPPAPPASRFQSHWDGS